MTKTGWTVQFLSLQSEPGTFESIRFLSSPLLKRDHGVCVSGVGVKESTHTCIPRLDSRILFLFRSWNDDEQALDEEEEEEGKLIIFLYFEREQVFICLEIKP